jgi:L-ribulose-5-phosphate 4-epimerase
MSLQELKQKVYAANQELFRRGLILLNWGNVSAIDREKGIMVIKPANISFAAMTPDNMAVVDLCGKMLEGGKPSSDMPTHLELYKGFPDIGAIAHTHSLNATAFAQAGKNLEPFGTTHADCFFGNVPCARALTTEELRGEYEKNTAHVILERFTGHDYLATPAVLVANHGAYAWGESPERAVEVAVMLEAVAELAIKTLVLNPLTEPIEQPLLERHYYRKHKKQS